MGVRGRLSVWRRQIPQNSGGNEGEAELKKNFEGERINRKEKETVLWKKEETTSDPERTNRAENDLRNGKAKILVTYVGPSVSSLLLVHYVVECCLLLRKGLLHWHWQMCGVRQICVNMAHWKDWSAMLAAGCGVLCWRVYVWSP